MHPTQLRDTLSGHDADPETVLSQLKSKQRARRRRQQTLSGLAAAVLVAGGGTAWWSVNGNSGRTSATDPGNSVVTSGSGFAGCLSLKERIATAERDGVSLITARGRLTGRIGLDGYHFRELVLTQVRTLVGAKVADGAVAWTLVPDYPASPQPGGSGFGPDGPLWGPGNALIGSYAPKAVNKGPLAPPSVWYPSSATPSS